MIQNHSTFYKNVEAQSVTPFASRALDRGLTGAMISMMRLTSETLNPNTGAGEMKNPVEPSPDAAIAVMAKRANDMYGASKEERTRTMATVRMEKWSKEAKVPGRRLGYKLVKHGGDIVNLLEKPGAKLWEMMTVPQSMREVEPGVRLIMDSDRRVNDDPDWEPPKPSTKDGKATGLYITYDKKVEELCNEYGKDKMTTFERYFIADSQTHKETKNPKE